MRLHGGDARLTIAPDAPSARYRITLASGTTMVGAIVLAEAEAAYYLASYRAIPAR